MFYQWRVRIEAPDAGPVCDFCSSEEVYSVFTADPHISLTVEVGDLKVDHESDPGWAACRLCHDLIEKGKWDELEDRCVKILVAGMGMSWAERREMRMKTRQIHSRFRDHMRRPA